MLAKEKKILIIDEDGFSRICSAILTNSGYQADVVEHGEDLAEKLNSNAFALVVISYPFGAALFDSLRKKKIPIIILTDGIDERLIGVLNSLQNSFCMIKPVDYDKFKNIVKQAVDGSSDSAGGYSIV